MSSNLKLLFANSNEFGRVQNLSFGKGLKYATGCKWVRRFNDGWESIENDPGVGRPVSVLTEKSVATVKRLIEEEARYTV